jgi:Tfp pilus assembly ATPase PilU
LRLWHCEFEFDSWLGILDTTLYDKACQRQVSGFFQALGFPPPIKLTATIITKINEKMVFNEILRITAAIKEEQK